MAIRAFQLGTTGLARLLGSLEAELLEIVWRLTSGAPTDPGEWVSVTEVCRELGPSANYKTVQTVLNRLTEKGLLVRRDFQRPHTYRATATRDQLVSDVTRAILQGLVADFGDVALAQLVRAVSTVSPEHRTILERLAHLPDDERDDASEISSRSSPIGTSDAAPTPPPDSGTATPPRRRRQRMIPTHSEEQDDEQ